MEPKDTIWQNEKLIETLQGGGVVVMPTDTVYGIVARAENSTAVNRIYTIRKRNTDKPCIMLIGDMSQLEKFGIMLTEIQRKEIAKYWPGPVSIGFECTNETLTYLHRGKNSLVFRMPKEESLQALLKETGPLVAPSANIEGMPVAKNITEAKEYFGDLVDLYADGGEIIATPSKIIKLNGNGSVEILRD